MHEFFEEEYLPKRIKKKIKSRNLAAESVTSQDYKNNETKYLSEIKFVPQNIFPAINSEVNLFGSNMHCMSFDQRGAFALIIEDEYLSKIHEATFEMLWTHPLVNK
ncbi:hypothetical protein IPJ72_06055 [Candidatus Peregrinibacteria bacterium]|nr:MAG: hypothetical protein IPJ72_06055 [Candidatus Peregrinibacteria bacterium]